MLVARPARAQWALAAGTPVHREPLVERTFATADALATALRELHAALANRVRLPAIRRRARRAVGQLRCVQHQQGDLAAAAAGY